jgi:predicted nucleotidyltransferase
LFGSRARGDGDNKSDYDLLIITPQTFAPQDKIYWTTKLDRAIINAIKAPVDILLNSEEEVLQKQELPGHIVRSAIREGVAL